MGQKWFHWPWNCRRWNCRWWIRWRCKVPAVRCVPLEHLLEAQCPVCLYFALFRTGFRFRLVRVVPVRFFFLFFCCLFLFKVEIRISMVHKFIIVSLCSLCYGCNWANRFPLFLLFPPGSVGSSLIWSCRCSLLTLMLPVKITGAAMLAFLLPVGQLG